MAIDLAPITMVTGLPGSGKTLFTLKMLNDYAFINNRKVFYSGIPELTLDWEILENPKEWHKLPKGSIFLIDEAQSLFPPRSSGSAVPDYVSAANTLRHLNLNLIVITQHPMLLDNAIRKLTGKHYHVKRFYGFEKSTIHEFQQVRDNVDKSTKNSIEHHFVYPKEVYTWYKSADKHSIKRQIPLRLILIVLLPIILVCVVYYGFKTVANIGETGHLKQQDGQPLTTQQADLTNVNNNLTGQTTDLKEMSYTDSHKPEIINLPFTAPIYKKIIEPVTAPFPAACIVFKSKGCRCYSQQGTRINTTKDFCMNVVENGFFLDFDPNPKTANKNKQSSTNDGGLSGGDSPPDGDISIPSNSIGLHTRASPLNAPPA